MVIAGGGGRSTGGAFTLDATIGQCLAGPTSTGANFSVVSGFWSSSELAVVSGGASFDFGGDIKFDSIIFRPPLATRRMRN